MKPDRSNYETWLIDWLDGLLTVQQTEELMAFLDDNPDIREEADSFMLARISPSNDSFAGKEKLLRSVSDIAASQAEYFSAAYLEGDLSAEQKADLQQNIERNPDNRIIFNTIQKIKLIPPVVHYRNKSSLKRITISGRIARISVAVLSAAAFVVFIIFNHMFVPRPVDNNNAAVAVMTEGTIYTHQPIVIEKTVNRQVTAHFENGIKKGGQKTSSGLSADLAALQNFPDTLSEIKRVHGPESIVFPGRPAFSIHPDGFGPSLIAAKINFSEPAYDDERSKLNRFIARTFRDKILKEKQVSDAPLKTYEVAEAGIEGLNKLLGWQMALVKTNDESGELKSVYFSSNILKFNAPVRKTTEMQ
ncbi:MAG: hypothetical protein ABSA76_14360 [Bacteroidales bacterium]